MVKPASATPTPPAPHRGFYDGSVAGLAAERNVGILARHLSTLIHRAIDLGTLPLGLTASQWRPLLLIKHKGMDTPAELARGMGVDTGAVTRMLDRLEAKAILHRARIPQDRRVVKVVLTDAGNALAERILPIVSEALDRHLAGFTEDEFHTLLTLLARMVANGEHYLQQASDPARE